MQISKISLALCVLALGATPVIRAADTAAQASARAALVSKLFEIGAETPVTNKTSAAQVQTEVVAPAAAPIVKPRVKATEPVMVPMDKSKAKAEQATMEARQKAEKAAKQADAERKADELKAQKQTAKIAALHKEKDEAAAKAQAKAKAKAEAEQAVVDTKAKKLAKKQAAEQKAAEVAAAKKQVKFNLAQAKVERAKIEQPKTSTAVKTSDTPEQAKAREAIAHALFQDAANNSTAPAAKPATPAPVAKPIVKAKPMKAEKPIVAKKPKVVEPAKVVAPAIVSAAPPLPINSVQQHKLAELLTKYKADMVTPAEYQKLRAEILANP